MTAAADHDDAGVPPGAGDADGPGDPPTLSIEEAEALVEFLGLVSMVSSMAEVAKMLQIKVDAPMLDRAFHTLLAMTAERRNARMTSDAAASDARMAAAGVVAGEDG